MCGHCVAALSCGFVARPVALRVLRVRLPRQASSRFRIQRRDGSSLKKAGCNFYLVLTEFIMTICPKRIGFGHKRNYI